MSDLLEEINYYYLNNGEYPTVKVSREFYFRNPFGMAKVLSDGIDIEIDDNLKTDWRLV